MDQISSFLSCLVHPWQFSTQHIPIPTCRYLVPIFTHHGRPIDTFCPNRCLPLCSSCKPRPDRVSWLSISCSCCTALLGKVRPHWGTVDLCIVLSACIVCQVSKCTPGILIHSYMYLRSLASCAWTDVRTCVYSLPRVWCTISVLRTAQYWQLVLVA